MYHQNNLAYDMFQVFQSGNSRVDEIVLSNMVVAFDRVLLDIESYGRIKPGLTPIRICSLSCCNGAKHHAWVY
ncbi:hypothetical protein CUMW_273850, partial [Citrus unshiu]